MIYYPDNEALQQAMYLPTRESLRRDISLYVLGLNNLAREAQKKYLDIATQADIAYMQYMTICNEP